MGKKELITNYQVNLQLLTLVLLHSFRSNLHWHVKELRQAIIKTWKLDNCTNF